MIRSLVLFFIALGSVQELSAQIHPSAEFILGDTTSRLEITDLFIGPNGTVYSTGQRVNDSIALVISAVSSSGETIFELFRTKGFEEKGLFIRPYDQQHFIVCGHSEDKTGTFNVRLLKLTYSGTVVWDTTFGNDGMTTMEMPRDIEFDSQGNIIIGGISQSDEIKYLLLKFSPSGELIWSRKSAPFENGLFTVHDIILDDADNIYGLTNNTFIADTSHGTVIKWDPSGTVVWSRNFNLSCYEERGVNLVLSGDTLYAAGSPWKPGENSVAVTVVALRTNGELISYRTIPLYSNQQGIRALRRLTDGSVVLLDETYTAPKYRFHTLVFSASLTPMYRDSLFTETVVRGKISEAASGSFDVFRYGGMLTKVRYSRSGVSFLPAPPLEFNLNGRFIDLIAEVPPFIAAMSRIQGSNHDRVHAALYNNVPAAVRFDRNSTLQSYGLFSVYPNPFNPSAAVSFHIPVRSHVTLSVYDQLGRKIDELISREMDTGTHSITWNGRGRSSGTYYFVLTENGRNRTIPALLLR